MVVLRGAMLTEGRVPIPVLYFIWMLAFSSCLGLHRAFLFIPVMVSST